MLISIVAVIAEVSGESIQSPVRGKWEKREAMTRGQWLTSSTTHTQRPELVVDSERIVPSIP